MNDKIVTHEDLETLQEMRDGEVKEWGDSHDAVALLDRLIAAAEADQPPLPEGWVLLRYSDGSHGVFYYPGRGDVLTRYDNGTGGIISVEAVRKDLTPLRPTVTEADVEKAAYAIFRERDIAGTLYEGCTRDAFLSEARAALKAAGIEVSH